MSFKDRGKAQRKVSIGVALCRRHPTTKCPQILLVKSRTTYNFTSFVFGKYKFWDSEKIQYQFNRMTCHEKLLVWSCDFAKMWYHIWLKVPVAGDPTDTFYTFYINCRTKFDRLISKDSSKRIKSLLTKTTTVDLGWEIPKGRLENGELEIDCGVREMREESGISSQDYYILHNIKPICTSHEDEMVTYVNKYYVAYTDKIFEPVIDFNSITQLSEVSAVRWTSLKEANLLTAQNGNLGNQVRLALTLFKREHKLVL